MDSLMVKVSQVINPVNDIDKEITMLPDELLKALNTQLKNELYSAYLYLSMAAYFDAKGLTGFAQWMKVQAREELEHAMKFYDYINDRGGRVILEAIEKPPTDWESITDVFRAALEHEKKVTANINNLVDLARKHDDKATQVFLNWFIQEQVEEEKSFAEILQLLEYVGEKPHTVLMLNAKLAQRK